VEHLDGAVADLSPPCGQDRVPGDGGGGQCHTSSLSSSDCSRKVGRTGGVLAVWSTVIDMFQRSSVIDCSTLVTRVVPLYVDQGASSSGSMVRSTSIMALSLTAARLMADPMVIGWGMSRS